MADYDMKHHYEYRDSSNGTDESDEYRNPYNPYERKRKPKKTRDPKDTYATAALIGGIMALINLCCFAFTTSIIFGVGSVTFAYLSKKDGKLSTPAKIAIFLGVGGVVFGVAEYFAAIQMFEMIKKPENIAPFNAMFRELENMIENQEALLETFKH